MKFLIEATPPPRNAATCRVIFEVDDRVWVQDSKYGVALLCVFSAKDNSISKARLDKKLFIDPEVSRKGSVFPLVVPSCVGEWGRSCASGLRR